MAAAKKIEKEAILECAFEILRKFGIRELNARSLAKALNCSTKPIYFQFKNMDEIKSALKSRAEQKYVEISEQCRGKYDNDYLASGMAYIKFAKQEKCLFQYLYLNGSSQNNIMQIDDANYEHIIRVICERYRIDEKTAKALHYDMAIYAYGLAVMLNTGFRNLADSEIEERLSVQGRALRNYYVNGGIQ